MFEGQFKKFPKAPKNDVIIKHDTSCLMEKYNQSSDVFIQASANAFAMSDFVIIPTDKLL